MSQLERYRRDVTFIVHTNHELLETFWKHCNECGLSINEAVNILMEEEIYSTEDEPSLSVELQDPIKALLVKIYEAGGQIVLTDFPSLEIIHAGETYSIINMLSILQKLGYGILMDVDDNKIFLAFTL